MRLTSGKQRIFAGLAEDGSLRFAKAGFETPVERQARRFGGSFPSCNRMVMMIDLINLPIATGRTASSRRLSAHGCRSVTTTRPPLRETLAISAIAL